MKKVLALSIAIVAAAMTAKASTITITGSFPTSTTWQVTASEPGDSAGVYGIGFSLQFGTPGTTGNTSLFKGPTATFYDGTDIANGSVQYGFTNKLGPSGTITDGLPHALTISQGLSDPPGNYFYNVGAQGGSMATNSMDTSAPASQGFPVLFSSSTYLAPVVLFSGNRSANEPMFLSLPSGATFNASGQGAGANLNTTPTITLNSFPAVPEPSSIILMGLACVGLAAVRRRLS